MDGKIRLLQEDRKNGAGRLSPDRAQKRRRPRNQADYDCIDVVSTADVQVGSEVGRGLSLRMDHGTQYVSEHFGNQVRFWGVEASYSFIEQPQTNGVAERFFHALKEQIVYGRVYRTVAEVRDAVDTFVDLYNDQWLPEKNGFVSPSAMREAWCSPRVAG